MESKYRSWVEIDLSAFRHNLRALKKHCEPHHQFMQIVKADAYGHGAIEISRVAVDEGASLLGVANVEEGKLLRIQGCNSPILILSPSLQSECEEIVSYQLAA
ncbi:MAG: alanine racemase, partial [Candidatus Cloacimonadaceae bacterium]